jgi:hypothetical protein
VLWLLVVITLRILNPELLPEEPVLKQFYWLHCKVFYANILIILAAIFVINPATTCTPCSDQLECLKINL